MSFAVLAKELEEYLTLITFDWRGHGNSTKPIHDDLSEETLINDALNVLIFVANHEKYHERSIIVCGHSMGGAIASKLVTFISKSTEHAELYKKIKSLFVIDVVEGSAIEALPMMEHIVKSRPDSFSSL